MHVGGQGVGGHPTDLLVGATVKEVSQALPGQRPGIDDAINVLWRRERREDKWGALLGGLAEEVPLRCPRRMGEGQRRECGGTGSRGLQRPCRGQGNA